MAFLFSAHWAPTLPGPGHSGECMSFSDAAFDQVNPFLTPPSYKVHLNYPIQMSLLPPYSQLVVVTFL